MRGEPAGPELHRFRTHPGRKRLVGRFAGALRPLRRGTPRTHPDPDARRSVGLGGPQCGHRRRPRTLHHLHGRRRLGRKGVSGRIFPRSGAGTRNDRHTRHPARLLGGRAAGTEPDSVRLRGYGFHHRRRPFGGNGPAIPARRVQRLQTLPHGYAPPPRNPLHRTPLFPRRSPLLLHLHQPDAVGHLAQRRSYALHAPRAEHAQHTAHAGRRTRRGRRAARPLHPAAGPTLRHHGRGLSLRPAAEPRPGHAAPGRKQHPLRRPPERPRGHCRPPGTVRRGDLHAPLASAAETPAARPI